MTRCVMNLGFINRDNLFSEVKLLNLEHILISNHYCYTLQNSIIAYDIERIDKAQNLLKELEQKCTFNDGWLNSIRTKWFSRAVTPNRSLAKTIEEQIITADAYMNQAILTFFTQDISGFVLIDAVLKLKMKLFDSPTYNLMMFRLMKGSWLLRKAWKIYQSTYSQIYSKYAELFDNEIIKPRKFID